MIKLNKIGRPYQVFLGILVLFALLFIFKGCFEEDAYKNKTFHLVRSRQSPINLMGRERDLLGFIDDLIVSISQNQKIRIVIDNIGTNQLFELLDNKRYDGIVIATQPSLLNERWYQFSDPFYLFGTVLVVPSHLKVSSLEEMDDKRVAVKQGAAAINDLSSQTSAALISYENMNTALSDLLSNRIDGVFLPAPLAYSTIQGNDKFKIVNGPLTEEGIRIVARADETSADFLISKINEGLSELKNSGAYQKLIDKWGLINFGK
jgi:ABC-type amino acid transport substrate-binding protein